ncbi:MAG: glycosyltransferase family 2 protein [Candidatus Delongbacteria bacterium]|nr:glycosyltransferase family 2 protein [Candidatus Delongbacteria bacterium]
MIYFIVPVYNEELNIEELASSLKKVLPEREKFFVFIDDHSTDNTLKNIDLYFGSMKYHIITKEKNAGPGDSFNIGFEYLLDKTLKEDLIITIEADNTSSLEILDKMVTISELGYGIVLASPYAQGGGFEETTLIRKILSFVANTALRFIFDIKVLTLSSFYRVYKPEAITQIKNKYGVIIEEPGFICMVEVLIKAIRCKISIIEVPMVLSSNKRKGRSKMKIMRTMINYSAFLLKNIFKK